MEDSFILEFQQLKISVLNKLEKINSFTSESSKVTPDKSSELIKKENIEDVNIILNNKSPVQDLLKTLEIQRRKAVVNNVQDRLKKLEDFSKQQEVKKKKQWLKKQQEFVSDIQQKEDHIFQALKEYDKSTSNRHAQLSLYYKNLEIRRQQHENEIKKRENEKQILYSCIDKIKKIQLTFRSMYEKILQNLKKCTKMDMLKTTLSEEFKSLNVIRHNFEGIINKCKNAKVTEDDVETASDLVSQLQNIEKKISQSTDQINASDEQEKIQKPSTTKTDVIPKTSTVSSSDISSINKYVNVKDLNIFTDLMKLLEEHLQSFKNLENDSSQKQFILDCKKAVNIPVNSLSGLNSEHILDKYTKLYRLLKGQDVIITDKRINASSHPMGISFCTNLLAKRFVLQSDLIVSSNPESAFCYATVIMSLWNEFPVFGQLMLAYFYKTCPFLVPYNIPRQVGESDEEYYKRLGYQYNNELIEKQDKYLKRMTGVMRLYTAIMIVKPKKGHINIYNIQNGWKWLASTLKLEPQVDITATLVHVFLEIAGFEMETYYGKMFQKIIKIIAEQFIPSCREKCTGGAVTRLELLLMGYYQKRKFEIPDGYLGYNYW